MTTIRNVRLKYGLLLAMFIGVMAYLVGHDFSHSGHQTVCPFHLLTGYPCPGCGIGRGLIAIAYLDFHKALLINPLSYIVLTFGLISIFWLAHDIFTQKETYLPALKRPWNRTLKFSVYGLLIINWIWNIIKGL